MSGLQTQCVESAEMQHLINPRYNLTDFFSRKREMVSDDRSQLSGLPFALPRSLSNLDLYPCHCHVESKTKVTTGVKELLYQSQKY